MSKTTTKTWITWKAMIQRCTNPEHKSYSRYGGRGISVAARWMVYENFVEDMGEIPEGLTLDRIDNDGHYEPGNIRFATMKEQARNRCNNRRIEIDGRNETLAYWNETTGVPISTMINRLRRGWKPEDVVKPINTRKYLYLTVHGKTQSLGEWARETGLKEDTVYNRVKRGFSPEECIRVKYYQ